MKTIFLSRINPQNQMPFEWELFEKSNKSGEIFLLLYSWNGKVISTGKLQKYLNINTEKCKKDGVCVIQRITGGRAVFHSNDICYSISIPKNIAEKSVKNVNEATEMISLPIKKTFTDFGINIDGSTKKNNLRSDFCAGTHSFGEISVNGKKIAASSQILTADGILQHGTIPISDDYINICDYFYGENESMRKFLRNNSTCLSEICKNLKIEDFLNRFSENFSDLFIDSRKSHVY